jgi:spermidine synthase
MQPWEIVDRAKAPDGAELQLARRGDEWVIRAAGRVLMSSRVHGSEEALAALALSRVPGARTVLLGGLGLGFTLRAVLDRLAPDARAIVAELVPALVAWNRAPVAGLAGRPLDDPRVRLQPRDVLACAAEATRAFDAILLDVDNGPAPLAHAANARLYGMKGIRACADALKPCGVLAVWSAGPDDRYLERLEKAGLAAEARPVPGRSGSSKGVRHVVFVATKPADRAAPRPVAADRRPGGPTPRGRGR